MAVTNYEQCIEILKLLDLHAFFPKKITREMALTISDTISRKDLKERRQIPWFMLDNLLACNYEGMTFALSEQRSVAKRDTSLSGFLEDSKPTATKNDEVQIHPLDALVSLFLCSDDFLRQMLVEKLSKCQLGIPLLLPVIDAMPKTCSTEMLFWATSTLKKQWKDSSGISFEHSMAVHPLPIVAALRLGRPQISKSKILNQIISKHDIFVNSECKGCGVTKVISNGLLEMAWHLPMGNEGDNFAAAFGIMNLRGDAYNLEIQNKFLMKTSSTTIIFCQHDIINKVQMNLITSWKDQNCLILVFDEQPIPEWTPIFKSVITEKRKEKMVELVIKEPDSELVQLLRELIKKSLSVTFSGQITAKSLENCEEIASEAGIRIDDKDTGDNFETKLKAGELLKCIEDTSVKEEIKDRHLPLQKLASCIAIKKRELLNMKMRGTMQTEMYVESIMLEIEVLRKTQLLTWEDSSKLIMVKQFLESFAFSSVGRSYFYHWTGTMLDRYSSQHLQHIRRDYYDVWQSQCESSCNGQSSATTNLETFQHQIHQSSLGLENLNREIAQVYEMASDLSKLDSDIEQFPNIAAEMLLDGQPLEIMDGDATYVPVTWLQAVLACLKRKVGNTKIFVLSILGVQGSGKSTMLNTMFGLKFAVSAGRCTKGAFAQLVSLDPAFQSKCKCKYILVIDTEGLRAPEFASIRHSNRDNEMATFVIGLGDATIINVMGENQTDIQDILQIVVHALMKMESVNLKPSCVFVHQNVSDVSASEKSTTQKITLRKLLDQTTQISAEVQGKTVASFADVINFKGEKHVVHISNLWQGEPPMAPPNPGYVRCVVELKKVIFTIMEEVNGITIDDFKYKLTDLWKAVLCEDFVFSFKNTLEIQAYTALETEYIKVTRDFRQMCMNNCNALVNACRKIPAESIEIASKKIFEEREHKLKMDYKSCFNQMKEYLKENPRAAHWEAEIKHKLSALNNEMRNTLKEEFKIVKQTITWKSKIDGDLMKYEREIHKKSRELAKKFRDSAKSETELERVFDERWKSWIDDLPELTILIDIKAKLEDILLETFEKEKHVIRRLLENTDGIHEVGVTTNDIKPKIAIFSKTEADLKQASIAVTMVRTFAVSLIRGYKGRNCNDDILKETVDVVSNMLTHPPPKYHISFTPKGIAKNTCCILWKLLPEFKALETVFREQNDPRVYMASQRENLWKCFQNECDMMETTINAAFRIKFPLINAITEAIKLSLVESVTDYFRTSLDHKYTFVNKRSFHAKMLIDLAEKKSFELATGYLANPSFRMSCWLQEYILNALQRQTDNKRTVLQNLHERCVGANYQEANTAITTACQNLGPTCQLDELWKQIVHNFDLHSIPVSRDVTHIICGNFEIKVDEFLQNLSSELTTSANDMEKNFVTKSKGMLKDVIAPVVNFFEKDLIGCEEVCPFCKAPCDNLSGCKNHRTECHRPQAFGGHYWDESKKLVVDLCTTAVGCLDRSFKHSEIDGKWHSFHEYRKANKCYDSWKITPFVDSDTQLYWKWFIVKYNNELAKFYGCEEADIPKSWKKIKWKEAKKDLKTLYNLST